MAQTRPAGIANEKDRRQVQRIEQYFECTWLSEWSQEDCVISSLSTTGCFVNIRSSVPPQGTELTATIKLPSGDITVQGTVVHAMRGVGFAVQFTGLDEDTHATLSAIQP